MSFELSDQMKYGRDLAWWEVDRGKPEKVAKTVIETVQDIERRQSSIYLGNQRHARIYAGYLPSGLNWSAGPGSNQRMPFAATKALVRSVCDTATALISRFRPKASFITLGADWDVQKQAEDMDIFLSGAYERGGLYPTAGRSFHDTTVFGTGLWKLVPRSRDDDWWVSYNRVLPDDFVVDEDECREGLEPENTYHRVIVNASAVMRKYANGNSANDIKLREKIRAAANITTWPNRSVPKDRLIVVEAINPEARRRVVAIEGAILADEEWPYDWHPYVVLWWAPPLSGFYGDGVAYRQFGRQERITFLYRWIEKCQNLFARPTAWVDPMGGPPSLQISNEIGAIVTTRRPPVFQVHQAVPAEIYQWVDELARGGHEDEGISMASASNVLPPGIESAPAQREYSFKESNRFAPVSQRWEHAVAVETAIKTIAMYRRRAQQTKGKGLSVAWADRKLMYRVEWPDLPEDSYLIRPAASSLEALSPAARMQAAIELSQTKWLRPGEGRALLGHPDLERSDQLDNAGDRYAQMILKRLLKGEVVEVDEYADLVVLDKVIRQGRLDAITRGAPPELIDNCSAYLDRLNNVVTDAAASAAMGGMTGQMSPTAGPANTPMGTPAAQGMPMPFAGGQG